MEDLKAIIGLALAFAIVVGAAGYFVLRAAGKRRRSRGDSGDRDKRR